ncbi:hypothetical protein OD762_19400, partial [Pseudomonas aeruginosa]|uniref:ACT domain-containing protein n=1 Tax=Pseudomonas aeruginosa TaxID=287 RepID=UPI00298E23FB
MAGETSLRTLLRTLTPELNPGDYVFCTCADGAGGRRGPPPPPPPPPPGGGPGGGGGAAGPAAG